MGLRIALGFFVMGIVSLMTAGTAGAQEIPPPPYDFFPDDLTPKADAWFGGNAIVGFKEVKDGKFETPSSPTLTVGDNENVRFLHDMYLYNGSTLNLNGTGRIEGSLILNDSARAALN